MEVSGQFHTTAALLAGEEPPIPIGEDAGWDPEPPERGGKEKNSEPPPGLEPPIIQPQYLNQPTNSMQHSPSLRSCHSDTQEIPRRFRNPKIQYRVHNSPPPDPILKAYWGSGSGGIAPSIFYIGTTWRRVVRFTHRPL